MGFSMPLNTQDPKVIEIVTVTLVAAITAITSILRKITNGHAASIVWVITQFFTAILAGYFMYEAYPTISQMSYWPNWLTMPIAVAIAAHSGGRVFQEIEDAITKSYFNR